MALPTIPEVEEDFAYAVKDFESLIETLSTKNTLTHKEYITQYGAVSLELVKLWNKVNGLIAADLIEKIKEKDAKPNKKYSKTYEELRKIQIKMLNAYNVEQKFWNNILFWEHAYQTGKMRKALINHFTDVLKKLKKAQKRI